VIKKTFQSVINQMDAFLTSPVGVMDCEGFVLATNASENMTEYSDIFISTRPGKYTDIFYCIR